MRHHHKKRLYWNIKISNEQARGNSGKKRKSPWDGTKKKRLERKLLKLENCDCSACSTGPVLEVSVKGANTKSASAQPGGFTGLPSTKGPCRHPFLLYNIWISVGVGRRLALTETHQVPLASAWNTFECAVSSKEKCPQGSRTNWRKPLTEHQTHMWVTLKPRLDLKRGEVIRFKGVHSSLEIWKEKKKVMGFPTWLGVRD